MFYHLFVYDTIRTLQIK